MIQQARECLSKRPNIMSLANHNDYNHYHELRWREHESQGRIKSSMTYKTLKIVTLIIFRRHVISQTRNLKKGVNILYLKLQNVSEFAALSCHDGIQHTTMSLQSCHDEMHHARMKTKSKNIYFLHLFHHNCSKSTFFTLL